MDPDTRPIKAQVGTNKEAGAGALGVLPILSKHKENIRNISEINNKTPQLTLHSTQVFNPHGLALI